MERKVNSLSDYIKGKSNTNVERLSLVVSKLLEKGLKENYDSESETPETFEFPLILKEHKIDYKNEHL